MLKELFPRAHTHYSTLPLLGPIAEGYARWLLAQDYRRRCVRLYLLTLVRLDQALRQQGHRDIDELTREHLRACRPDDSQDDRNLAAIVTTLTRYLDEQRLLAPSAPEPLNRTQTQVTAYRQFLIEVRGFAASTQNAHVGTATQFLEHIGYESQPQALEQLSDQQLETFVQRLSRTQCRASVQHSVAHVRSFLRFLAEQALIDTGWEYHLDMPRCYRQEQLPRTLPWETVSAFLASIDRATPMGLGDYTLFFLMAHYGLRACDVVALTLDDFRWRQHQLHLTQRKTAQPLVLPLTDAVGNVVIDYLRQRPPTPSLRVLLLRARAPLGALKPTAVHDAFNYWSQRSQLQLPFTSPHCLRHSYAAKLLRQGTSLKAIGDLLGHRTLESTVTYLRLAREHLREVALEVPQTPTTEPRS